MLRGLPIKDVWAIYNQKKASERRQENIPVKNLALDIFLDLFYEQTEKNHGLSPMSEMKNVVSHLCQEFMSDILQVTSSVEDEDDSSSLQQYLLNGRGWLLLYAIYSNGLKKLTVTKDLSNLLVSLLPWCLKFPVHEQTGHDVEKVSYVQPLSTCFYHLNRIRKWLKFNEMRERVIPNSVKKSSLAGQDVPKSVPKRFTKVAAVHIAKNSSYSDSDNDGRNTKSQRMRSQRKVHRSRSLNSAHMLTRQPSNQDEDNQELIAMLQNHSINQRRSTPTKIAFLIIDILQELCLLDTDQSSLSKMLSPSLLAHFLHIFKSLYPSRSRGHADMLASHWPEKEHTLLQRKLLRGILVMSGIVATQQNGINVILGHKLVPGLLEVARQMQQLQTLREELGHCKKKESASANQTFNNFLTFSEILLGLLMCLDVIFQCLPFNLISIKTAVQLVEDFEDGSGLKMMENVICTLESWHLNSSSMHTQLEISIIEPVKLIGSFLNSLKSLKVNYIHAMKCVKRKHQKCNFSQYFDHHHNILGLQYANMEAHSKETFVLPTMSQESVCLITSWCTFLLSILPKISSKVLQVEVLKTLQASAICCCMQLEAIVTPIHKSFPALSPAVQSFSLDVVNHIILELLSKETESLDKSRKPSGFVCMICADGAVVRPTKTHDQGHMTVDSGFSSREVHEKTDDKQSASKWSVLDEYRHLLFSENSEIQEVTANCLFHLVINGSSKLREELFFRVYMSAFKSFLENVHSSNIHSSSEDDSENHTFSPKVKVHCLSALPHLLKVDAVLQTFLTRRSVGQICYMLNDDILRAPVLKVFEALVILDEDNIRSLENSSETLSLSDSPKSGGVVMRAFIDGLAKKTAENLKLDVPENSVSELFDRDTCTTDNTKLLQLVDMWETCAKICLNSESFVTCLRKSPCKEIAENFLIEILKHVLMPVDHDQNNSTRDEGSKEDKNATTVMKEDPPICFLKLTLMKGLLTVCSVCHKYSGDQKETEMWRRITDLFVQCPKLPSAKLKSLFDILLSSAMPPKTTVIDSSHSSNIPFTFIPDDVIEDEEVRKLLNMSSEDDEGDPILNIEQGYDADSESQTDNRNFIRMLDQVTKREYFCSVFRLLVELLISSQKTDSGQEVLQQMLLKLLQTLRANHSAVMVVCNEGLLKDLLDGFWDLLVAKESNDCVRNYVLSLIQLMAQHRITSIELQKILQLFQHSHIPQHLLLSMLLSIAENSRIQPFHSIQFPVKKSLQRSVKASLTNSFSDTALQNNAGEERRRSIEPLLRRISTIAMAPMPGMIGNEEQEKTMSYKQEVWKLSAVQIPIQENLRWPPIHSGFTLSMWVQIYEGEGDLKNETFSGEHVFISSSEGLNQDNVVHGRTKSLSVSECVHIISIGNQDKLLEVWCSSLTGNLLFRLTSETNSSGLVIRETISKEALYPGKWHHMVITYVETLELKKSEDGKSDNYVLSGKLNLTLNGWLSQDLVLDEVVKTTKLRTSDEPAVLCIGQVYEDSGGQVNVMPWSLGSVTLFKGHDISREECFHLYSLGPGCQSICKCDSADPEIVYSPYLTKHLVQHSHIPLEVLVGLKSVDMDRLRISQLLSYDAENPTSVCYFPLVGMAEMSTILAGNLGLPQPESLLLTQQPETKILDCQSKLNPDSHHGLEKAILEAGGMEAILFLVAKIVEANHFENDAHAKEQEMLQAKALQLLFTIVNHSPQLTKDYMLCSGNSLITKVLISSRSIVGYHTLKVMLDASTTESMFRFEPDTGCLVMRRKSEAMIRSVMIIQDLILNWRIWEETSDGIMDLLFRALASLIREDHPHQAFNIKQFQSAGIINKIFCAYQERIQDGLSAFPVEVSQSVVSIVKSMLGSPPDLHMIVSMCDFLLFVHPAANSYINYSHSGFYFNLWWNVANSPKSRPSLTTVRKPLSSTPLSKQVDEPVTKENKITAENPSKRKLSFTKTEQQESQDVNKDSSLYPPVEVVNSEVTGSSEKSPLEEVKEGLQPSQCTEESTTEGSNREILRDKAQNSSSTDQCVKTKQFESVSDLEKSTSSEVNENVSESPVLFDIDTNQNTYISPQFGSTTQLSVESVNMTYNVSTYSRQDSAQEDEGLYVPRPEVHFDENTELNESERGLVAVCVGLLQTLCDIVINMPDSMVTKVFDKVLKPDILIILCHNNSPQVRAAVIKLLHSYLSRADEEHIEDFIQKERFHLLGAQLYQYPAYIEHIEEVMSLILTKKFSFQEGVDKELLREPTSLQQSATILLMTLLANTVSDVGLCHYTLVTVQQLCESAPFLGSRMLDHGLMEVICNMISRINIIYAKSAESNEAKEHYICLKDIQSLLCIISNREFSASGASHFQQFEDIIEVLRYTESKELTIYDEKSQQIQNLRTVQLSIILCQLQYIEMYTQGDKSMARQISVQSTTSDDMNSVTSDDGQLPLATGDSENSDRSFSSSIQMSTKVQPQAEPKQPQPKMTKRFSLTSVITSLTKKSTKLITVSQTEIIDRFKKIIVMAVDLVVFSKKEDLEKPPESKKVNLMFEKSDPVSTERTYTKRLLVFLYRAYEMTLSQEKVLPWKQKSQVMFAVRDVARFQLGRLMTYMLSTKQEFDDRTYVLSFILGENKGLEILKVILATSPEQGQEMAFYLMDLLTAWKDWLNSQQREDAHRFLQFLKNADIHIISQARKTKEHKQQVMEEKEHIESKYDRARQTWKKKKDQMTERLVSKFDRKYAQLTSLAMDVTKSVTQLQTQERNKFIEHIKRSMTEKIQIKKSWQQIVQNLTHERAVWHDPKSYPQSWQLDPTEGPGRVRKRLKRCHLGINKRFLQSEVHNKTENEFADPPLIYLFEDDHQTSDSAALLYQLYRKEKIQHTCRCTAVSPFNESKGELLVGENSVFFVADEAISDANYTQVLLGNKDQLSMTWPYEDIREIYKRWFQLRDIGIEIFLTSGKTCLLACENKQGRDFLYQHLMSLELPNFMEMENLEAIQRSWTDNQLTNFDYLIHLNKIAGRSFNDLMQYPIFPFVLKDYFSENLDLKKPDSFRNLSKPMSVQEKSKEAKYIDNFNILKQDYDRHGDGDDALLRVAPYHYGSHYSNSGTVLHFLVRLPPFTKMFLTYQDNNFDLPDRTFHSVQTAWRLASFESATDVKELIPEFFFLPEFLENSEGFKFGKRQNGMDVNDVNLPPWCKSDPRLFVLILRQALESECVTQNLHNWIDLVFGYKQQGEAAVRAINVFHPSTYFGVDVDSVKDPVRRHALRTMVKTYGQTPKQLFRQPHPQRKQTQDPVTSNIISQLFLSASHTVTVPQDPTYLGYVRSPVDTVSNLRWGVYVGSLDLKPPEIVWQQHYDAVVASLIPLPTGGDVFGIGEDSCFLTMHSKQRVATLHNNTDVIWAAILDWKQPDGILRINNQRDKPVINFLSHSSYEKITCCASVPNCRLLFVGGTDGVITIYQTVYNQAKESHVQIKGRKRMLYGHSGRVNSLVVCKQFSIIVSGSEDGTCIIWDLNRLCYVRSIVSHKSGVKVVAISSTLGDIATVSTEGPGSRLQLHSINAKLIAENICIETSINCLAFSTAPEGESVNIVAGGLDNGIIRLWSGWDLMPLRDLHCENLMHKPVISLAFAQDSKRLYMSSSDGTVSVWESPSIKQSKPINFIAYLH